MDMAKFKSQMLNKLASKDGIERERKTVTLYLHRLNFEEFRTAIKPLSPSQVIDAFILETIEAEKKKK